jgi:signal transduction histidine kinase
MQKIVDNIYILIFAGMGGMMMFAISFILMHIKSQNKFLKQKDREQKLQLEHQQELLRTVINSQEVERKRIGQDLHDDVGTALSNLRLVIAIFNEDTQVGLNKFSNNCKTIIDKIIKDVRNISHNLSPPGIELYGFSGALEELCDSIIEFRSIQITIHNKAEPIIEQLSAVEAISLYRVMEELLNNTIKHAEASLIDIYFLVEDHQLFVIYKDNGIGLSTALKSQKGMGLHNIESRLEMIGATITLPTTANKGYQCQFIFKG